MALIAKVIKGLITLASLAASIEAIIRLAKLAWNLWLQFKKIFKAFPNPLKTKKGVNFTRPI